ncbi:MAG: sporulation integral membrane protein YtvI [Clostridia bacterium]|nr:sporulation integral membrane protein YtvI [Clostridia bacterium]
MIDYKVFFIRFIGLIAIILTIFGFITLSIYFLPFLIATIVVMTIEPLIRLIHEKCKINKKIVVAFLTFFIYGILGFVIFLVCTRLIKESAALINIIPTLYDKAVNMFNSNFDKYKNIYDGLPETITIKIYDIGTGILTQITQTVTDILNSIFNFIMFLPTIVMYAVVTILATYFIGVDKNKFLRVLKDTLPKKWYDNFVNIIDRSISSVLKYFKAEITIAGITFILLIVAFIIVGQPYPFTIAIFLALLDVLPVIGIGAAMVPWAIYLGIIGDISGSMKIIVIYTILLIIRQIIEPKIVSNTLGIKPIVTLFSMFLGFKILGILGIIAGPILALILKDVFNIVLETGYIKSMFVERKGLKKRYRKRDKVNISMFL